MTIETAPASAGAVFGARLSLAKQFADLLATDAVPRGLIGPREPERLWSRHLLNCAAITELFPAAARVVDVGSGAGLPGLVIAIRRPDLSVDLLEPSQRRVDFLLEATEKLKLGHQVRVVRGRAEDANSVSTVGAASWVTARAVAPLNRLAGWCSPLLVPGGRLVAMKGSTAADEVAKHHVTLVGLGMIVTDVVECGEGLVEPVVTVVVSTRGHVVRRTSSGRKSAGGKGAR